MSAPADSGGSPSKTGTAANAPAAVSGQQKTGGADKKKMQSKLDACMKFTCNKKEGTCLGRTGLSWLKIIIFYIIFYFMLFSFFIALLFLNLFNFDVSKPRAAGGWPNLIGEPGLRNFPGNISFEKGKGNGSYKFLNGLNKEIILSLGDSADWGPCVPNMFGFNEGKPCVLIRPTKIVGWRPDEIGELLPAGYSGTVTKKDKALCISCEGNGKNTKNINITYYSKGGGERCIADKLFNYKYQKDKPLSQPFIFAHFPDFPSGDKIDVTCKAYNKKYKDEDSETSVSFTLFLKK